MLVASTWIWHRLHNHPHPTPADIARALAFSAGLASSDTTHSRHMAPEVAHMLQLSVALLLDHNGDFMGLRSPSGTARAFALKPDPDTVRLIEDMTMHADVPPAAAP